MAVSRANYAGSKRKTSARVVLNRKALTALGEGLADGLAQFGQDVIDTARPNVPDAPPVGRGLVATGGYIVFANGRKVAGTGTLGKLRGDRRAPREGFALYVGYGFPARFLEHGTIHMRARPFLAPAVGAVSPNLAGIVGGKVRDRLAGAK